MRAVIFEWKCDVSGCNNRHRQEYRIAPNGVVPNMGSCPSGWNEVNSTLICDRHLITYHLDAIPGLENSADDDLEKAHHGD